MVAPSAWPDWWKAIVGTAMIGVPIVLWLAATQATATSAYDRSAVNAEKIGANADEISVLWQREARDEARWEEIQRTLKRIESAVDKAK